MKLRSVLGLVVTVATAPFRRLRQHRPSFRRVLPALGMVSVLVTLSLLTIWPTQWYWFLLAAIAVVILNGLALPNYELVKPGWWHALFTPSLLVVSATGFLLFLGSPLARQLAIVFVAWLLLIFWENLWRLYWDSARYHPESLENVSLAMNTVVVWSAANAFFNILLDPTVLPLILAERALALSTAVMLVIVFLLDYRTIWVRRYAEDRVWLLLMVQALIVSQLFWATNFLPHGLEVKAFLVTLAYYLFTNLGRAHFEERLSFAVLRRYAYVATAVLLFVLVTSRWFI